MLETIHRSYGLSGAEMMPHGLLSTYCESISGQQAVAAAAQALMLKAFTAGVGRRLWRSTWEAQFENYVLELVQDLLTELGALESVWEKRLR